MILSACCKAPLTDEAFGAMCSGCKEPSGPSMSPHTGAYVDIDPVNSLLQKEERPSAVAQVAARAAAGMLLAFLIALAALFVLTEPDERVTGWMSNDAGLEVVR
jgi:hypothetical protein